VTIDALADGSFIVVSKRLRELIEAHNPKDIEFLPVTIKNHKKRVASTEYTIMHGAKAIEPKYHFIEKKKIMQVEQLVDHVLRDAILEAKIAGVTFIRSDRWPASEDDDGDDIDQGSDSRTT
jgi:hypothetical protein